MALFTELTESKARLIPGRTKTPTIAGDTLARRWEYIDATTADTLMASVPATVTNPQADGQTYTGTFAVGEQTAQAQDDRSVTITQGLTLINSITASIATLSALSPLKEYDNEILRAFSLEEGEGDRISWTYKNINPSNRAIAMSYSDSDLETTLGAGAGEYLSRKFTIQENGTATFVIITEGHAWSAWGHDLYAADKTEYDNAGTDNERERITKTWYGIRLSGVSTAVGDMRTGTNVAAESGYIITSASVGDNGDGSLTCVQMQKKQVNNKDAGTSANPQNTHVNPHGWDGGRIDAIETHYEHFTASGLASAISGESAPVGYVEVRVTESIDGDGLYSRIYLYEKPTFTNVTGISPAKTLANTRIVGYDNYDPKNNKGGVGRSITDSSDGIPIDDLAEVRDNQVADSGYAITNISIRDNKDGSGTLARTQIKKRATTDQFVVGFTSAQGNRAESQTVMWRDLSETDADTVYNNAITNEANMTLATPASPASHVLKSVEKPFQNGVDSAGNQLFSVTRTSWIPTTNGAASFGIGQGEVKPYQCYGTEINIGTADNPDYEPYIVIIDRIVDSTLADAVTFANGSHTHPITGRRLGKVEWNDSEQAWIGYKETWYNTNAIPPNNNYGTITDIRPAR